MARRSTGTRSGDRSRTLNILVIVALVSMLAGTILLITARDPAEVHLPPGEEAVVFSYDAPTWDPWGHPMEVKVFAPANFTLETDLEHADPSHDRNETEREESVTRTLDPQNVTAFRWYETAEPGESWKVRVTNHGESAIRLATEVSCYSYYIVGGILVGFGLLGFVFYKLGMSRDD